MPVPEDHGPRPEAEAKALDVICREFRPSVQLDTLFSALNEALTDRIDDVFKTAHSMPSTPVTGVLRALPEA